MPDVLGWRKKFGVLAPSTNTVVEPEFYMMGVPGVTAHISRILMSGLPRDRTNPEAEEQWQQKLDDEMKPTIERVLTCEPDYMVMGMSAPTFRGGESPVEATNAGILWRARNGQWRGSL